MSVAAHSPTPSDHLIPPPAVAVFCSALDTSGERGAFQKSGDMGLRLALSSLTPALRDGIELAAARHQHHRTSHRGHSAEEGAQGHRHAFRLPTARASASEQNQRSPFEVLIRVLLYD